MKKTNDDDDDDTTKLMKAVALQVAFAEGGVIGELIDLRSEYQKDLESIDLSGNQYTGTATESTTAGGTPEEATEATHAGATTEATSSTTVLAEEATAATNAGATHEEATEAATPGATNANTVPAEKATAATHADATPEATNSNTVPAEEATAATNAGATCEEPTEATTPEATNANTVLAEKTTAATHAGATHEATNSNTVLAEEANAATHAGATTEEATEATNEVLDEGAIDDVLTTEHLKEKKQCTETIKVLKNHAHLLGDLGEVLNQFEDEVKEPGSFIKDLLIAPKPSPSTPDMQTEGTVIPKPSPQTPDMKSEFGAPQGSPSTPDMLPDGTAIPKPSPQTPDMVSNDGTHKGQGGSTPPDDSGPSDDSAEFHPGFMFKKRKGKHPKRLKPIMAKVLPIYKKKKKRKTDDDSDNESSPDTNKTNPFTLVPWQCMLCFNFVNCVLLFHGLFA